MTDAPFEFPEGKALRLDTEVGLSGPEQIVDMLKEAAEMELVDDLDRGVLLQCAAAVGSMQTAMDHAIKLLNLVSDAHGKNARIYASDLFLSLSITIPSVTDVPEDEGQ